MREGTPEWAYDAFTGVRCIGLNVIHDALRASSRSAVRTDTRQLLWRFEQWVGDPAVSPPRLLEVYTALQDRVRGNRSVASLLRRDFLLGAHGGDRALLRWRIHELLWSPIRELVPPDVLEALEAVGQFLAGERAWGQEVSRALRMISGAFSKGPLRERVQRRHRQFIEAEWRRIGRLARDRFSPRQIGEAAAWLTQHDVTVAIPEDDALYPLYLLTLRAILEPLPPSRYQGLTVSRPWSMWKSWQLLFYMPWFDLLGFSFDAQVHVLELSEFALAGATHPFTNVWHKIRWNLTHELVHRWDVRHIPQRHRMAYDSLSWQSGKLGSVKVAFLYVLFRLPGLIRKPDLDSARDMVWSPSQRVETSLVVTSLDAAMATEDLAEVAAALVNPELAQLEVSRAIGHLLAGRPHLANKIAFAYSFFGNVPNPNGPWIVRTDGAPPNQLHGTYVFQDIRGRRFELILETGWDHESLHRAHRAVRSRRLHLADARGSKICRSISYDSSRVGTARDSHRFSEPNAFGSCPRAKGVRPL